MHDEHFEMLSFVDVINDTDMDIFFLYIGCSNSFVKTRQHRVKINIENNEYFMDRGKKNL